MTSLVVGLAMFVIGAVLAVIVNLHLLPYLEEARDRSADSARVMGWIARSILLLLPIGLAIVGASVGPKILEGAR